MNKRSVIITEFLTEREIKHCMRLYETTQKTSRGAHNLAKTICDEVIKPSLHRINQTLGQQNDPMYLAYMVEYVLSQMPKN